MTLRLIRWAIGIGLFALCWFVQNEYNTSLPLITVWVVAGIPTIGGMVLKLATGK